MNTVLLGEINSLFYMKILVTGAAGFIGSHTAKFLCERGDSVVGIDCINDYYSPKVKKHNISELEKNYPDNFLFYTGDILDQKFLENFFSENKFDKVCHLAARAGVRPSIEDPFLYEEVNVRGTLNMLEQAKRNTIKNFVYASSSSVYGECTQIPFSEDLKLDHPISPYAASKKANENYAYTYSHLYTLPTIGLRFFTVYGPSGRPDMAPFLFSKWIDEGTPLKKFGDGTTKRDYTYIDDIVSGVVASLDYQHDKKTPFEIFNLGNNTPVDLNTFISLVEKFVGKKTNINQLPMQPGDVPLTCADTSYAQKKLGYSPKTSFEEGMKKFVDWYMIHKDLYLAAPNHVED